MSQEHIPVGSKLVDTGMHRYRAQVPGRRAWCDVDIHYKSGARAAGAMREKMKRVTGMNTDGFDMRYIGPVMAAVPVEELL